MASSEKYSIQISWSNEDECFIAISDELPNLSAFGDTYDEVLHEIQEAMSGYLEVLGHEAKPEPLTLESYSGQFRVRLPRSLHKRLAIVAKREGVSLNTLIIKHLSESTLAAEISEHIIRDVKRTVPIALIRVNAATGWNRDSFPFEEVKPDEAAFEVIPGIT